MTLFKMSLPKVEVRPPVTAEKPTTVKSDEEESARFLAALQQAQERKPAAKPVEQENGSAQLQQGRAIQNRNAQDAQEIQEVRKEQSAVQLQEDQASSEVEASKNDAPVTNKPRDKKKADDGWEGGLLGLPGTAPLMYAAPLHCVGMESRPAGFAQLSPPPAPGTQILGQAGITPGIVPGQGMMPPGGPGHEGVLSPQMMQHMADTMAAKVGTNTEGAMTVQLHGADEKQDGSFAMRLMDSTTKSVGKESMVKATLPAHAPTFGEDLAEQVGRMRVISRPGVSEQVRITLHPKELGALDMRLVVDEQHQVHLMITTDSDAARDVLNRQMPQLREALARQNLSMGEVTVHVDDGRSGGETTPEWGFQGENNRQDFLNRPESTSWRGARPESMAQAGVEALVRRGPLPVVGGGGLSLFA